jgi:hypothetical protein
MSSGASLMVKIKIQQKTTVTLSLQSGDEE